MENNFFESWRYSEDLPRALYTANQCRSIDRAAIDAGTPGIVLMKRAAEAVVDKADTLLCNNRAAAILVFCGTGNNGGDGFLIAKIALERGWTVRLIEVGDVSKIRGDAKRAREAMSAAGVNSCSWSEFQDHAHDCGHEHIIIDALLGTGFSGAPRPDFALAIEWINAQRESPASTVIAVDVPSGLCSDTGQVASGVAVKAHCTVSFIVLKQGLFLGDAVDYVGIVTLCDLKLDEAIIRIEAAQVYRAPALKLLRRWPKKSASDHKYSCLSVVVIGGDQGMGGAALLASSAALKLGSGIVKLLTGAEHVNAALSYQPELLITGLAVGKDDPEINIESLIPQKAGVLLLGPGLSDSKWSRSLVQQTLGIAASRPMRLVVDAGAISLLADDPKLMRQFIALEHTVLTPHAGEALRLLNSTACGEDAPKTLNDRLLASHFLATRLNSTVVLKGPGTVCAYPPPPSASTDQTKSVVAHCGNAVLATGGTGDVLAGMIASALAQMDNFQMAIEAAVVLHGATADYWRRQHGPHGFTASELIVAAPALCNRLLPTTLNC